MKKIIIATLLILISISLQAKDKKPKPIQLKITYIHREDGNNEIWAKSKRYLYMATCSFLPDSIKLGKVIKADPYKNQKDCICLFKRVR